MMSSISPLAEHYFATDATSCARTSPHGATPMKLIGTPERFTLGRLYLKPFQRIGIGLESGTQIHLVPMPPRNGRIDEVIVSTLDPKYWHQLFRLTAVLRERPGVVASVLKELTSFNVNINILETLTTSGHEFHELLAIVTLAQTEATLVLEQLQSALLSSGAISSKEDVSLQALHRLAVANDRRLAAGHTSGAIRTEVRDKAIVLNREQWIDLFSIQGSPRASGDDYATILMYSDTEEKYLCLFFPEMPTCLLRLTVKHRDQPGALYAFTDPLQQLGVNIVNSYSRLQQAGDTAEWHATLDVSQARSCRSVLEAMQSQRASFIDFIDIKLRYKEQPPRQELSTPIFSYDVALKHDDGFFGREDDVQAILDEPTNILLNGYHKTGKSSLLGRLQEAFLSRGAFPVYVSAEPDPRTFFSLAIYEISRALCHAQLMPTPTPPDIAAFIASGVFSSPTQLLSSPPSGIHPAFPRDTRQRVTKALQQIVDLLQTHSRKPLVLLIDDAHNVLYSKSADGGSEVRSLWIHLLETMPKTALRWVLADSHFWREPLCDDGSPIVSKINVRDMRPMRESEAARLVQQSFARIDVSVETKALDKLLYLTGRQPYFLQVACKAIQSRIALAPKPVDIVTMDMIARWQHAFLADLQGYFAVVQKELISVLGDEGVNKLIAGVLPSRRANGTNHHAAAGELRVSLHVLPAIVELDGYFSVSPTFALWYGHDASRGNSG